MAINNPRISAGPTIQRRHVFSQPVETGFYAPTSTPEYAGQLFVLITLEDGIRSASLYIAVDSGSGLEWKDGVAQRFVDGLSGDEWADIVFTSSRQ